MFAFVPLYLTSRQVCNRSRAQERGQDVILDAPGDV